MSRTPLTSFRIAVILVVLSPCVSGLLPSTASARTESRTWERPYRPPMDRPVVDPFRPPTTRFGPGNRGLEYASVPGDPVSAIGAGTVTFAGAIGAWRFVTVQHADGRRSSYSRLTEVTVRRGEVVRRGGRVGTAGEAFHLGLRVGDTYIDPAPLIGARAPRARLVPLPGAPTHREPVRGWASRVSASPRARVHSPVGPAALSGVAGDRS